MDNTLNKATSGIMLDCNYLISRNEDGDEYPQIEIYYRDTSNQRRKHSISNYRPYIYVECDQTTLDDLLVQEQVLQEWVLYYTHSIRRTYNQANQIELLKITGKKPWDTPKIRNIFHHNGIKTHESDIPFVHRYLIDHGIFGLGNIELNNNDVKPGLKSKIYDFQVMSFDIEIDIEFSPDHPSESLSNIMDKGSKRITMISCSYGTSREQYHSKVFTLHTDNDQGEIDLIRNFWSFTWSVISPDIIVTYNGDNFDIPYMMKRMTELNIPINIMSPHKNNNPIEPGFGRGYTIPGVMLYDLFKRTKWLYTEDGRKSLGSVAKVTLGKSKKQLSSSHGEMWRLGLSNNSILSELEEYAKIDAELTYELFYGLGMSEWVDVIRITGSPPREAMYYTQRQAGEFLLYRVMFQEKILIPFTPGTQGKKERDKERKSAEGGFVFEPTKSIASGVMIADFSSMYPTLMISHNIGAESFLGTSVPFKERFQKEPRTSMALMQKMLLDERLVVKQELLEVNEDVTKKQLERYSWALKIVMNSTIGSYNYTGSRLYNTNISGSVTGLGRTYLQELAVMAKTFNMECETIYGDTDSVFIELPKSSRIEEIWQLPENKIRIYDDLPIMKRLLEFLQKKLPDQMKLDLQDVAYRILFHKGAKKRYSYVSAISKQVKIVGFEAVRHDWSPFSRDLQKRAINEVLHSGNLLISKQEMIKYLRVVLKRPISELRKEFITFGPIKRAPSKYKSITPAMSAFQEFCQITKLDVDKEWKNYDYFPFLIVKGDHPLYLRSKHPDFVNDEDIDIKYYLQEGLNAINRFNLNIAIDEIYFENYDLEEFFLAKDHTW